jgi:hypothetical protein
VVEAAGRRTKKRAIHREEEEGIRRECPLLLLAQIHTD